MITLDIDSSGIRILESDGDSITSWASHALDPEIFEDGILTRPEPLSAAIRELMNSSGIKGNRVTASVSGLYSLSRIIPIPTPPP